MDDDNRPSPRDIATSWHQYLRQRNKTVQNKTSQLSLSPSRSDRQVAERRADSDRLRAEEPRESSVKHVKPTHTSSLKREGSRSRSASPPKRSKAKPTSAPPVDESRAELSRGPMKTKGKPWDPDDPGAPPQPATYDGSNVGTNHRLRLPCGGPVSNSQPPRTIRQSGSRPVEEENSTHLIKQPETRPISQEQLVAEVKGIYAGLVMVENKCIEVDSVQNVWASNRDAAFSTKLDNEQWQALIALHRTLLHEHHDFFLASQHPGASPALRRLASKYAMPARMWRHGIHSFLELLRHKPLASLEHMLTFIYLAYSMMALLYETVPAFEDTWIECLGDIGRYRMAFEDDNLRDREVWTRVNRGWYSKASDKTPTTGRLYHHLAILARPNMLQQLFYYGKSLCVAISFQCSRESIMALFDPCPRTIADVDGAQRVPAGYSLKNWDPNAVLTIPLGSTCDADSFGKWIYDWAAFPNGSAASISAMAGDIDAKLDEFINTLDNHIGRSMRRFLKPGYYIGISNCCAIIGYGQNNSPIYDAIKKATNIGKQQGKPIPADDIDGIALKDPAKDLAIALRLTYRTHDVILRRFGDPNILTYVHTVLVFIYYSTFYSEAMVHLGLSFPWKLMSRLLSALLDSCQSHPPMDLTEHDSPRPLPEDYAMSGLLWAKKYYPSVWISSDINIEDDTEVSGPATLGQKQRTPWTSSATSTQLFLGHPGGQLHAQETGVYRPSCRQRCRSSLGQCHHGHIRRARLSNKPCLEKRAMQSALDTLSPNTPGPTYSSEPKRHTLGNLRVGPLLRLLRFFIPLYMVSVSLALTTCLPRVPWHASKVFLLAASAMGSFGTGMVSLNLDIASPSGGTRPADMSLRVVSSLLVGVLFVGYIFWFLGQRTKRAQLKRAQFTRGTSLIIGLWVIVRLLRASSNSDNAERNGSHYLWLDELNLLACASVVAGIANAERSIFSSAEGEDEDNNGEDGPREGRRDDIEGQRGNVNGRRVGDGGNGSSAGPGVMESVSTALQAVAVN